jgi:hypothetical protein
MDMVDILGFFFTLAMTQIGQVGFRGFVMTEIDCKSAILYRYSFSHPADHGIGPSRLWTRIHSTRTISTYRPCV